MKEYTVFMILIVTIILFISGRWRYDIVACCALITITLVGAIPFAHAFSGFSNPAVITVASVMVITQAIMSSGILNKLIVKIAPVTNQITIHILSLSIITALLSAFMNNVAALMLMMPIAIQTANNNNRSPSLLLMPIAFSSILGGLTTLIGTPANIIISSFRQETLGSPFSLFDFSPVGISVAVLGIAYIITLGWRFIPKNRVAPGKSTDKFHIQEYITEVRITEESAFIGKTVDDIETMTMAEFLLIGYIRDEKKRLKIDNNTVFKANDILIIEAFASELVKLVKVGKLELVGSKEVSTETLRTDDVSIIEVVVAPGSKIEGRTPQRIKLHSRYMLNLIGIARQGESIQKRLKNVKLQAGDVLLLQGNAETLYDIVSAIGFLPIAERGVQLDDNSNMFLPSIIFIIALILTIMSILPVQIAFTTAVLVMVLTNVMPIRRVYESIDWSIIVLLGAMIPVGNALQATGGSDLIAKIMINIGGTAHPSIILGLLMIITMMLTDAMNNAATAVLMAPISITLAKHLGFSPDPFLMTVAIGASCAFLTPIGHQNNTLVMGPGGYHFSDYWRMGLLLDILIIAIALPVILYVWPIY